MDIPWGFLYLLNYAIYQDNIKQILDMYSDVPRPPKKIIYDSRKFNKWIKWARNYKPRAGRILPFGQVFDDEGDYYSNFN